MSFLPLIIDESVRQALREVVAAAAADPVPLAKIQALADGELQPLEVNRGKTVLIPMGFQVVYTHEHQPHGVLRHMSVSIDLPGRVPHPEAVRMIMAEVGFVLSLDQCVVWEEVCSHERKAINVVEPLNGNWDPHRIH